MTTETSTIINPSPTIKDNDGDLSHIYCLCDENTALCGWDLTDADDAYDVMNACIVCEELDSNEDFVCPQCKQ